MCTKKNKVNTVINSISMYTMEESKDVMFLEHNLDQFDRDQIKTQDLNTK